ncbi:hypothetical protein [Faecalitalea cylindroides]|uniref:hypothetical protein n=1 Tax=Faecalitalea cylindroides TaxID=39483 RepID=UPI0039F4CE7E
MYKVIKAISINQDLESNWNLFQCKDTKDIDLTIDIDSSVFEYSGIEVFSKMKYPLVFRSVNTLVSANSDWSKVNITLLDGKDDGLEGALSAIIMTHLSIHNGLLLHASLIEFKGKGILFVGPSGIGKTTQAELWNQYRDALIINGDMALIHYENSKYYAYGYPIHGSSSYCLNRRVELAGIVVLEQDLENKIEELTGICKVERVMHNVFLPKWFEKGVNEALKTLDGLLLKVPVYLLKCCIDQQAVELVERVLFK